MQLCAVYHSECSRQGQRTFTYQPLIASRLSSQSYRQSR